MQRFMAAVGWFFDALGRYPADEDFGLAYYRDIEFPREAAGPRPSDADTDGSDTLRLAS